LLSDYPREWKADTRVRFHLGASEIIGRLFLLGSSAQGSLRGGESALAQLRLEEPAVAARGDRFVIPSYSPSRTVGGGPVIEPVAERRRRSVAARTESLEVSESGSLESRVLEKLAAFAKPASTEQVAQESGEGVASALAALETLIARGSVVSPAPGR